MPTWEQHDTKTNAERMEEVKQVYRNNGYDYEQDFPKEYYFMEDTTKMLKVRLYYNGRVIEG